MTTQLNSLFSAVKILFLPKYCVKYYDYIVKWCSGIACNWVCIAGYCLNLSFKGFSVKQSSLCGTESAWLH